MKKYFFYVDDYGSIAGLPANSEQQARERLQRCGGNPLAFAFSEECSREALNIERAQLKAAMRRAEVQR